LQKLHLVGFTTDHEALIFSARKGARSGSFVVPLDDELVEAIDGAVRMRDGVAGDGGASSSGTAAAASRARRRPPPDSALTPREIQARLRSGRSIADVAGDAGVDQEWVERWAAPVIAEQAQVVDQVRGLHYSKPRLGLSSQPLGVAVAWNLRDKGIDLDPDELAQAWSAFQHADGSWAIRLAYTSRHRRQAAEWELDPEGDLLARNRLASELAYVEPGRRRGRKRVIVDVDVDAPAKKAAKRKAGARKAAPAKKRSAKPTAKSKKRAAPAKNRAAAKRAPTTGAIRPTRAAPARATAPPTPGRIGTDGTARRSGSSTSASSGAPAARRSAVAVRRSTSPAVALRRQRPLRAR
jgi:hypothetical protein